MKIKSQIYYTSRINKQNPGLIIPTIGAISIVIIGIIILLLADLSFYMKYNMLLFDAEGLLLKLLQIIAFVIVGVYLIYTTIQDELMDIYRDSIISPKIGKIRKQKNKKAINILFFKDINRIVYVHTLWKRELIIEDNRNIQYVFRFIDFNNIIPILKDLLPDKFEEVRKKEKSI